MGTTPSVGIKFGIVRGELIECAVPGSEIDFRDESEYEMRVVKVPVAQHVEQVEGKTKKHTEYKFEKKRVRTSKRLRLFLKVPGLEEFINTQAERGMPLKSKITPGDPHRIILGDGFPVIPNVDPDKKYRVKIRPLIDEVPYKDETTGKMTIKYGCRVLLQGFEEADEADEAEAAESLPAPSAPLKNDEVVEAPADISDKVGVLV